MCMVGFTFFQMFFEKYMSLLSTALHVLTKARIGIPVNSFPDSFFDSKSKHIFLKKTFLLLFYP